MVVRRTRKYGGRRRRRTKRRVRKNRRVSRKRKTRGGKRRLGRRSRRRRRRYSLGGMFGAHGSTSGLYSSTGDAAKDGKNDGNKGKTDPERKDDPEYKKANTTSKALSDDDDK